MSAEQVSVVSSSEMVKKEADVLTSTASKAHSVRPKRGDEKSPLANNHKTVCRELAREQLSRSDIARKFGVSPSAVTQYAAKYALEIDAIKPRLEDDYPHPW